MSIGGENRDGQGRAQGRRDLLRKSVYAGCVAACGSLMAVGCSGQDDGSGSGDGGASEPGSSAEPRLRLSLEDAEFQELKQPGGMARVPVEGEKYPLIVFRASESGAIALSARCPHQGCEVQPPRDGRLRCPCHASEFAVTGQKLSGPAPNGLDTYEAEVDEDSITIRGATRPS